MPEVVLVILGESAVKTKATFFVLVFEFVSHIFRVLMLQSI